MQKNKKIINTWIKKYGFNQFDYKNPDDQAIKTLLSQNIPKIDDKSRDKYGCFKILKSKDENWFGNHLIEREFFDDLYLFRDGKWNLIFQHEIYSFRNDIEHSAHKTEINDENLYPLIYVDTELLVLYIETTDGTLYCSIDTLNWFRHRICPKKRPYYSRIEKLIAIPLPNCQICD